jgi:hypothetical protein
MPALGPFFNMKKLSHKKFLNTKTKCRYGETMSKKMFSSRKYGLLTIASGIPAVTLIAVSRIVPAGSVYEALFAAFGVLLIVFAFVFLFFFFTLQWRWTLGQPQPRSRG